MIVKTSALKLLCATSLALVSAFSTTHANAITLNTGESISYAFDFTSFADMSGPARGLNIIQRYSNEDILSGSDEILLEIMATPAGATLTSSTATESKFGPSSAWGFNTTSGILEMAPIYSSYKGVFRITALKGSVALSEVTTTLRDAKLNDLTISNLSPVPELASIWTMLAGLGALAGITRINRKRM